jgi:hypothetical protein
MMTLFSILLNNLLILIFCSSSILINIFLLAFIKLGLLGLHLKTTLNDLLEKRIYLIPIFSFFVFILIKYHSNIMYLDPDEVIVSTTFDNIKFQISGEALTQIYKQFGSATVFTAGARIAAGLVAKHPMGLIPKVGVIGGTGSLLTINYKLLINSFKEEIGQSHGNISISSPVKIKLEKIEYLNRNSNINEFINNTFNSEISVLGDCFNKFQFRKETLYNFHTNKNQLLLSDDNLINNSNILKTLEQYNPN